MSNNNSKPRPQQFVKLKGRWVECRNKAFAALLLARTGRVETAKRDR